MRTTIEMRDEHRAALLELAARRGEKGFSGVVSDAIQAYLASLAAQDRRRKAARALKGTLTGREAERLRRATVELRRSWR